MQNPLRPRPNILVKAVYSLAVAVTLCTGTTLFAGTADSSLLNVKLNGAPKKTDAISSANPAELAAAVKAVIAENPKKYNTPAKAGIVAGEALKYNSDPDSGEAVGNAAREIPLGSGNNAGLFVAGAAKAAGSGKGPNVLQIPDFAVVTLALNGAATRLVAVNTAVLAKNKPGAGAILGGQASKESDDTQRVALANQALAEKSLKGAVQDIARFIGATTATPSTFAADFASANSTYTVKIATGVATSRPTQAGAIADSIFANGTAGPVAVKQVTTLAKTMAAVSDIEEVREIGNVIGQQIRAAKVKTSKAAAITKTLVKAISTAPALLVTASAFPGRVLDVNQRLANRMDEAAEVAAFMVSGIGTALTITGDTTGSKAAKLVLGVIKAAVTSFKNTKPAGTAEDLDPSQVAADVVASVAYTITQGTLVTLGTNFAKIQEAVRGLLTNPSVLKSINKARVTDMAAQLVKVYDETAPGVPNTTNDGGFENGFEVELGGAVSDPETDIHPIGAT